MNINATSSTASSAASSGLSGFAGIDTDSMVEKMLLADQTKINKQEQEKTRTEWKQEMYRDVIDKINTFSDTYFSATSSNYIGNVNLYETNKISSSNAAVAVSSANKNLEITQTVQVANIATASSVTGSKVGEGITANISDSFQTKTEDFNVRFVFGIPKADAAGKHDTDGGKALQFTDLEVDVNLEGVYSNKDKLDKINAAITAAIADAVSAGTLTSASVPVPAVALAAELDADGTTVKSFKYEGNWGLKVDTSKSGGKALQSLGLTDIKNQYSEATYKNAADTPGYTGLTFEDGGKTKYASYKFTGGAMKDATYSLNVNLDGVNKSLSYKAEEIDTMKAAVATLSSGTATPTDITAAQASLDGFFNTLKSDIEKAFGKSITVDYTSGGSQFKITAGEGQKVTLSGDTNILGLTSGISTNFALSTKIENIPGTVAIDGKFSVNINGVTVSVDEDKTVQDFINAVNKSSANVKMSYNSISDNFEILSKTTGAFDEITLDDTAGVLAALKLTGATGAVSKEGTNAVINIDGNVYQRTTNNFKIGELEYAISSTTGDYGATRTKDANGKWIAASGTDAAAKITTTKGSTDNAVKTLKAFVEDYNKLIEELNEYVDTKATYKDYPPLSDEQRKEMSESEIENWEKMGKVGLLRNDRNVEKFLQDMRNHLNKSFDGVTLDAIGIRASSNWNDKGKLSVEETVLKDALEKHGDKIYEMFRGKDGRGGLLAELNEAVKYSASKSSGSQGTLVAIAGAKGVGSEKNNTLTEKVDALTEKIKQLKDHYEERKLRLWEQFNSMETSLARMNSRASFFA